MPARSLCSGSAHSDVLRGYTPRYRVWRLILHSLLYPLRTLGGSLSSGEAVYAILRSPWLGYQAISCGRYRIRTALLVYGHDKMVIGFKILCSWEGDLYTAAALLPQLLWLRVYTLPRNQGMGLYCVAAHLIIEPHAGI